MFVWLVVDLDWLLIDFDLDVLVICLSGWCFLFWLVCIVLLFSGFLVWVVLLFVDGGFGWFCAIGFGVFWSCIGDLCDFELVLI